MRSWRMRCRQLMLIWICGVGIGPLMAQQANIPILQEMEVVELFDGLSVFHDPSGQLGFEEIRQKQSSFDEIGRKAPFRPEQNSTYWVYVKVENVTNQPTDWVIRLGHPSLAEIYISDQDSGFIHQKAGVFLSHSERTVKKGDQPLGRLYLDAGEEKEIYIRLTEIDHTFSDFELLVLEELSHWKSQSKERAHVVMGIFGGMLLIIILYNFILFFTTHSVAHIYYALYLSSVLLFVTFATDIMPTIPTAYPRLIPHIGFLSLALVSIFYFQFGRSFLNMKELIPVWDGYIRWYVYLKIGILVIEQLILLTTFHLEWVKDMEFVVMLADAIASVMLIVRLLKTPSRLSRFFIAGSSCVMVFAFTLAVISAIFHFPHAFLFFLIAIVVEILIFSLGLGYKIKMTEEEKLHAQEALTQQLLAADKMKDEFLANTSHELRTPLNGIIGIAESLYDGVGGAPSDRTKQNLAMIISSGKRLTNLVNDLLDFSKLKSFDLHISPRAVDMHALTDVVMMISEPLIKGKKLKLINEIPEEFPAVYGDENRLQQIMHNLIGNAIKFTEEGEVRVWAEQKGEQIWTYVKDTGIGIPEDKQDVIFQSFEQGDGSIERTYGGTGLGLSITQKLVELHNGKIRLQSTPGKGSTFSFSLPVSHEKASAEASDQLSKVWVSDEAVSLENLPDVVENHEGDIRILVVDDEPINHQVLSNHLSLENYHITAAMNGEEALEALEKGPAFDMVLLDIMMPRMSGYEVCKKIREKYLPAELPIIMITAKNQISDLVQGFSFGANDYLTKPFSKDEFLARIKTHLNLFNINAAYGRFVPHEFLKALGQESILDIHLGDQVEKEVTVLFSDIRSYTTLAESMTPQENFNFINAYLGRMGPIIQQNKGFVNQYYGDGIMALFLTAPSDAIRAAIEMLQELMTYNEDRRQKGRLPIRVGIGVHTGPLMLGIIGDRMRMEAGVVSDTVNTAARMEGLTKHFGVNVIVSEDAINNLSGLANVEHRFLGKVLVKGKKEPVAIYDFFEGDTADLKARKQKSLTDFEQAVNAYFQGNLDAAIASFRKVLAIHPTDKTAGRYLKNSLALKEQGLPEGWTGVEEMGQK